jgi:hypothetical protein
LKDHQNRVAQRLAVFMSWVLSTTVVPRRAVPEWLRESTSALTGSRPAERLVQNHQFRLCHHRRNELDLLRHALAERFDLLIGEGREAEPLAARRPPVPATLAPPRSSPWNSSSVRTVILRYSPRSSGRYPDQAGAEPAISLAEHLNAAGIGMEDAHDHPHRGGFAGAVGSDEAMDRALGTVERKIVRRPPADANAFRYALQDLNRAFILLSRSIPKLMPRAVAPYNRKFI